MDAAAACAGTWFLLLVTALLDFYLGQRIAESDREAYRRKLIVISIVANLGLLFVFKYTTWLSPRAVYRSPPCTALR